jgi:hypothetical protein
MHIMEMRNLKSDSKKKETRKRERKKKKDGNGKMKIGNLIDGRRKRGREIKEEKAKGKMQ